jgi:cyclic 2,3-diphosphoglycerate synthase
VDGEHYAPVVRDALAELPYDFVAAVLVGGTEKLRGGEDYGVPVVPLEQGLALAEVVVDLSDEPVLGPEERFALASQVLAAGLPYEGADFRFEPPRFEPVPYPSIAVIGTGKRVGKTAITGHIARFFSGDRKLVVVAMGRGGPAEPEVVTVRPTVADLLERSRAGRHAASDHLETAALTGVPTVGCRRCGGGLAGATFTSSVLEGARVAAGLEPELVVFDGSGAAIPPVAAGARILVAHDLDAGLNRYRALISDLVLSLYDLPGALRFDLRLEPLEPLDGRRTAVFTTGPAALDHLEGVVFSSRNLADRTALARDLEAADAEVYLVELKAAAIDLVAETAAQRGIDVVLGWYAVVSPGLDDALTEVAEKAEARDNTRA